MDRMSDDNRGDIDSSYNGSTYHGRSQLKPAPFSVWMVGGYIFLAGLSGASALIGALAQADQTRRRSRTREALIRRARYLSLLAPTLGSVLLVGDLHTPKRFYNMLRVAKKTSPMSIGTWILMSFSAFAGIGGIAQIISDLRPRWRWPRQAAGKVQVPAAVAGVGLATYTASLLSATSTPLWAAAPRSLAVRFASSSIVAATAALRLSERSPATQRALDDLLLVALAVEMAADAVATKTYKKAGVAAARDGTWGYTEKLGATMLGTALPLGLLVIARQQSGRPGTAATIANCAALLGSAAMRISVLGVGNDSAKRPDISMRFSQPENLARIDQ